MFINPHLFFALPAGIALYLCGKWYARRMTQPFGRVSLWIVSLLCSIPAVLFLAYYFHLFGEPRWYIELRALPGIESTSGLSALLFGVMAGAWERREIGSQTILFRTPVLIGMVLVLAPFLKPMVLPVGIQGRLHDQWQAGVCLQTSTSTCGPATLATVYAHFGLPQTERQIARGTYACLGGTELWYLLRYARSHGLNAVLYPRTPVERIPVPALLGTRPGNYGHFIALLGREHGKLVIGDPMHGRRMMTTDEYDGQYGTGGCIVVFSMK